MNRGIFSRRRVYLDAAAALPASFAARRAFLRAARAYGNPSSPHKEGRAARDILEEARTTIAREMETKADNIVFTSGATEANNIAIQGVIGSRRLVIGNSEKIHALYLPSAHASIVETMHAIAKGGVEIEPLSITDGRVDIEALTEQLRPETALISMDVVCGETGTIWNTRAVRRALDAARQRGAPRILFHADASQTPLVESIERTKIAADLITLDAQKIGGVRGVGILSFPRTISLTPIVHGGGQERAVRGRAGHAP